MFCKCAVSSLLSILLLLAASPVDVQAAVSGTALKELGEEPPSPPPGFPSKEKLMESLTSGKIPVADVRAPTPEDVEVTSDIEYGRVGDRPLLLDLYRPKKMTEPAPGLLFIHGGGWKHGKKEDYRYYTNWFAHRGYVVASVSYRMSGEAIYPAAVQDVKCAVRWMRANADKYHIDPNKIGVAGGSAGGHLALMIGYSSDVPELEGNGGHPGVSSRVQAVVDLYGPTDLTTEFARAKDLLLDFIGKPFAEAKELYRQASPIMHVSKDDPPTLILHGTIDQVVPIRQADLLSEKLKDSGVPFVYDRLDGWPHTMDLSRDVNERCRWFMERFFARYLD